MYIKKNINIRIGTRESALAVWQARQVQDLLTEQDIPSEIIYIKSDGDTDLITPLYAMGVQGVFTKTLDAALLNNRIDIAVHSLKDVPIQAAKGLQQAAVLERHRHEDILVFKKNKDFLDTPSVFNVIATGSIRRAAQWLNRYPNTTIENLRGNVNTRLRKLEENAWHGAIFAAAGLERLGIRPEKSVDLDWMLPAPAQGAIGIYCRENDDIALQSCAAMNHFETALCTQIERDFLKILNGGCSAPISALATVKDDIITVKGNILSTDGLVKIETLRFDVLNNASKLGQLSAYDVLEKGAEDLIRQHDDFINNFKKKKEKSVFLNLKWCSIVFF